MIKVIPSIEWILDRVSAVIGAFIGSQIPEFMQQYTQRLAGHVDELQRLVNQMRQVASYSNKTLEQYIHKFISSTDPDFARQGEFMQGMLSRWEELKQTLVHLTYSSAWIRPYIFLKELQYDIAHSTFVSFHPGINLSMEGIFYAGAGIVIGWTFYRMMSRSFYFGYSRAAAIFKQSL
jgi:Protein of unknown function (DUF2937)